MPTRAHSGCLAFAWACDGLVWYQRKPLRIRRRPVDSLLDGKPPDPQVMLARNRVTHGPIADGLHVKVQGGGYLGRAAKGPNQDSMVHRAENYSRSVDLGKPLHTWREYMPIGRDYVAVSDIADSDAQKAMGARLRQVRDALGISQREMADVMGLTPTALSSWESGRNQIDLVKLAKAAERYRFTTDWVALGDISGIRKDLADRLEAILKSGHRPIRRGRPPRRGIVALQVAEP